MNAAAAVPYLLVPFVLWRVYSRIKRLLTRQKSSPVRHWVAAVLFPLLILMFALLALPHPLSLAALGASTAFGIALGMVGLKKTRFEIVDGALYYTPNAHIGLFVSLIFIGRLCWRMIDVFVNHVQQDPDMGRSPATMLAFGLLAGYYAMYASGLLRYRRANGIR